MKKLLCVLLTLIGLGAILYVVTQHSTQARQLWNETLAKVPNPGCCCADCAEDDE